MSHSDGIVGPEDGSSLPSDDARVAALEIENGFRQYDTAIEAIKSYLEPDRPFALRPSLIQQLQQIAVTGIEKEPGQWRGRPIGISKSKHTPPPPHLVASLVQEMCDYVNDNLHERTPFHLAAYVMWRLNWIHPFSDGNGRTSRIISYIVLCVALKTILPGSPTIPQQIQEDRSAYFKALEEADESCRQGVNNVSVMEEMLKAMLAKQLIGLIEQAGQKPNG